MRYASVCDGIGAVHVAWKPLKWECAWTSEIDPFPAAVVEQRHGYRNLGDMTKITKESLDECGPVDLLVGGTPCQSFSAAGLRRGLEDPRGNLALRFVQLAAVMRPEWIVWENVPGVLSSGKGRDFGTFLGALAELGYGFAYRILDAQWFGVAQRRRRVFVVANARDWRRAAAVLFERESVFGNPPTRGAAREGAAGKPGGSSPQGCTGRAVSDSRLVAYGGNRTSGPIDVSTSLPAHRSPHGRMDFASETLIAFHPTQDPISSTDGSTHAMGCGSSGGCCTQAVAFQSNLGTRGGDVHDDGTSPTVRVGSGLGIPSPTAVAFKPSHYTRGKDGAPSEVAAPLSADADKGDQDTVVTFNNTGAERWNGPEEHAVGVDLYNQTVAGSVRVPLRTAGGHGAPAALATMAVRRLTPRECERLQGFPDDYTLIQYRNKPASDGPRYRALGNSMAVPVMRWIGERIQMATTQDIARAPQ